MLEATTVDELKRLAKAGDRQAVQALREMGFFAKQRAAVRGFALSNAQRRLWVLEQMEDGTAAYNIPGAIELRGRLDTAALEQAVAALVQRHESLRTTFKPVEGEPRQFVHEQMSVPLLVIDLQQAEQQLAKAQAIAQQEATTTFDLENGPLVRTRLLQLEAERHVFVCTLHHLIADGWSLEILVRELLRLYEAHTAGRPHALEPLKIQYKDFAAWQNGQLSDGKLAGEKQFWLAQLGGELPVLQLPTDYPRPEVLTFQGRTLTAEVEGELTDKLEQIGREQGATLFMVLTAVVKVLLYRYTGQHDIMVGTPIAGRDHPSITDQVGMFVNTLALRDEVTGDEGFTVLLRRVAQTAAQAFAHQSYPFDLLVSDLDVARDMSRNPIFDVLVNVQHGATGLSQMGDLTVKPFDTGYDVAKFDLTFEFVRTAAGLGIGLNYNVALFAETTMERMLANLQVLMASIATAPHHPIAQLNLLAEKEKAWLAARNETAAAYPEQETVISLFEAQVAKNAERAAVTFAGRTWTYGELNADANRLAWILREQYGVQEGEHVAILLDKSYEMVRAILAVQKAGGVYVPLDPEYPPERLRFMVADSGARLVLTSERESEQEIVDDGQFSVFSGQYSVNGEQQVILVDVGKVSSEKTENLALVREPERPLYIIYTSGSTGTPKGCVVTNRNVVRLMVNERHQFDFSAADVWIVAHSFCFDFSVWEMYGALLYGGRVVVAARETVRDTAAFVDLVTREGVTVLNQTPAAFYNFIEFAKAEASAPLKVRYVIFGGDRLEPTYLRPWVERYPLDKVRLVNMYGITETTVHVTFYELTAADIWGTAGRSPIGVPIPGTEVYVLNEALEPQPIGVAGELYVGGLGVAAGYLKRPKLTAARFITHGGQRLYKTGDLGRWTAEGGLEHLGRNDFQVQLRGFRVELGEIEAALNSHAAVEKSVVIARGSDADRRLLGYVTTHMPVEVVALRAHIAERVPDYMVPAALVVLEQWPLTSNGKIDRKALPDPDVRALSKIAYRAAEGATEQALVVIWSDILGVAQVGVDDDFFALGGHSLKATQVVNRIQQALAVPVGLRDLFRTLTVARLAKLIDEQQPRAIERIQPAAEAAHYAASHAQRRLWVIEQMGVARAAYNMPLALKLEREIDQAQLQTTIDKLVERHESLRTTFAEIKGELRQMVHETIAVPLRVVEADSATEVQALVQEEARYHFDLAEGPLLRVLLIALNERQAILVLNMHHIISDGWSLAVMMRELLAVYSGTAAWEPLAIQYKDYAQWQQDYLTGEQAAADKAFWAAQFADEVPVLDMPTDFARPAVQSFAGAEHLFVIPAAVAQKLWRLGQSEGATPFMTALALVNVLLQRYTGQEELVVGYPTSGRDHPDLAEQVGFYVNMLPLKSICTAEGSFVALLQRVKETVTSAFAHQMYPFDLLVEELALKRDMGRSPLFDVAVDVRDGSERLPLLPDLQASLWPIEGTISKFDLTFFFTQLADGSLSVTVEYSTDLFTAERIGRMGTHLNQLARSVVETPHLGIGRLELLSAAERERIVHEFNEQWAEYPRDKTIMSVFEAQVATTPKATAVLYADRAVSYRALNERANQVAHQLKERLGARPQERVGVLLDRSDWSIVALVAILKVGGVYLPIDPNYPRERVEYILQDADCQVVLSEAKYLSGLLAGVAGAQAICELAEGPTADHGAVGTAEDLAYIIYTSGSTGRPKGSLIQQRSVLRLVCNTNYIELDSQTRILQTGSLAFDASTFEIWGALLNGGCICLPDEEALLDVAALGRLIRQHGVTAIFITTSLFNQFVEADATIFKPLEWLLTGGEKVSVGHMNRLHQLYPALKLTHVYGPTENTTFTTYYPVREVQEGDVAIGYPIANSTVYIVDRFGQPVPVGVVGEICTGGDGVALGYLQRPELTAEKFVPNPFHEGKMYRTGDVGLWLPDGSVKFIGRIDNQLKIRGFRVEPGEIEQQLLSHAAVREAVVIPRTTTVGTKELLAYFAAERPLTARELRGYLADKLPEYMIPAYFVQMEKLPIKIIGKIDRAALPAPEEGGAAPESSYVSPRTEAEWVLAEVWQEVLGRPLVGIYDNYFELGGDSIRAIQMTSRLRQRGWTVGIQDLFANPVIAELGLHLNKAEAAEAEAEIVGEVPLTAVQTWFFAEHETGLNHFNQAVLLKPVARLDEPTLRTAMEGVARQHDMLRATYEIGEEGMVQRIGSADAVAVDVRVVEVPTPENLVVHVDEAHGRFDLGHGPLMSAVILRLPASDRLLWVIHHLVVDGVSWRILLEDLEDAYRQALDGAVNLGAKTTSFKRWAEAVRAYAKGEERKRDLLYWQGVVEQARLTNCEPIEHTYGETAEVGIRLTQEETAALLGEVHQAYTTEINDLLLAAVGWGWRAWCGEGRLVLTLEGHGRERLNKEYDVSRTVGWFTTMWPFILESVEGTIGEQIVRTKEGLRRVPKKGLDYGILRYLTAEGEALEVRPLVSFNYLGQFDDARVGRFFASAEEEAGQALGGEVKRPHELDLIGLVAQGQFLLSVTYARARYTAAEMEQLLAEIKAVLVEIIGHCLGKEEGEKTLSDFTMEGLDDDELGNILEALG